MQCNEYRILSIHNISHQKDLIDLNSYCSSSFCIYIKMVFDANYLVIEATQSKYIALHCQNPSCVEIILINITNNNFNKQKSD